jgi:hypothetical protein
MSDGHGSKRSSDGLISASIVAVALLAVAGLSIFWGYSKQVEYYRNADQNSSEYTRNTYAPEADRCIILPRESQSDCIAEASNKERTYRRDEQDLAAQKTSAVWAYLMGSAALIGMILSAFGVFLVWRTFSATREGNLIARDIGEKQVRAYLDIKDVSFSVNPGTFSPGIEVFVTNSGQSPSLEVEACFRVVINGANGIESKFDFFFELPDIPSSGEKDRRQINGDVVLKNSDWGKDWENIEHVSIQTAVFAYSVFDKEISASSFHAYRWSYKTFDKAVRQGLSRLDDDSTSHPMGVWFADAQKARKRRRTN